MNPRAHVWGILLMSASSAMFAIQGALLKSVPHIDASKSTFFRFGIGLAFLGMLAIGRKIQLNFVRSPLLYLRGLFGAVSVLVLYASIVKIGVAKATVLNYAYPLFGAIFGVIFLKETVRPLQWAAIGLGLAGLYLVIGYGKADGFGDAWGYSLLAVGGAMLSGLAVVLVRKLRETDSSAAIFLAQCAVGFCIVVIPMGAMPVREIGRWDGLVLVAIGIFAAIGQLFMTSAYRFMPVAIGSVFALLVPVFSLPIGLFIFDETLSPTAGAGMALVLLSCVFVVLGRPTTKSDTLDASPSTVPTSTPRTPPDHS